jgi:hypothetical protein
MRAPDPMILMSEEIFAGTAKGAAELNRASSRNRNAQ